MGDWATNIIGGILTTGAIAWATAAYREFRAMGRSLRSIDAAVCVQAHALLKQRAQLRRAYRRGEAQQAEIDEIETRVADLEQRQPTGE